MARKKLYGAALAAWRKKRGLSASKSAGKKRRRRSGKKKSTSRSRRRRRVTVTVRVNKKRKRRRSNPISSRRRRRRNPISSRRRRRRNPSIADRINAVIGGGSGEGKKRKKTWRPGGKSGVFRPALRQRKPSARVRKHLRQARAAGFKFNPGRRVLGGVKSLATLKPWQLGLSVAAGAGLAISLPNYLSSKIGVSQLQQGWGGVAFRGVVTVLASGLIGGLARSSALGASLLGGGMAVVVVDALRQVSALQPITQYLPSFGMAGMRDYLALSGYGSGMGNALPYAGVNSGFMNGVGYSGYGVGMPLTAQSMVARQAGMHGYLSLNAIGSGALPQANQISLEGSGGIY